jgi:hypothetical protein
MNITKLGRGHYRTRDGREVEILAVDCASLYPVHGCIIEPNGDKVGEEWLADGMGLKGVPSSSLDLLPIPEKVKVETVLHVIRHTGGRIGLYPMSGSSCDLAGKLLARIPISQEVEIGTGLSDDERKAVGL